MRRSTAVLCGATVVLAGSLTAVPAEATTSRSAQAAAQTAAQATTRVAWKKCATDDAPTLQCASVKVPLDYAKPQGRKITLALSRVPHTARKYQGPLLVNPGGPGGSGLSLAPFVASSLPKAVASQYDVIGFDPRGVGKSQPALDCKPGYFNPVRPDSVPRTAAIEKANLSRARAFAKACGTKYASVLPYINTVNAVKDMDAIRKALGAPKINYFGYSYGTYLGQVYAKLYPTRVRRLVLDSIVDPGGVWYDANISQDYAFDARQKALMAWIAKYNGTYKLGTDPAKIEAKWYAMRAAFAKHPAGGKVGASELEDTFIPGGYYNGYWPTLASAFAAYVNGNNTAPLVSAYESIAAIDASGDNGYSVYTAVQCRDVSWPRDWNQWRKDNWAVYKKAPFMAWNNAWYNAPCAYWPTKTMKPVGVANSKLPPVLLFQATNDAATPYQGGVAVHRLLKHSSLVVEQGGGNHGITLSGNACLDKYLAKYLTDGTVPRGTGVADAVCKKTADPQPAAAARSALAAGQPATAAPGDALHRMIGVRG
ncbi:alpha/beta hydrolase [Streptomyces sp. ID05-04B]|uniref:alpha/beta hydrolase n=1 Tax=unclassified Streptomyces TaxID=2593676 RepID=UPI000D1AF821|nr:MULTISPECIES: alpha/beta hydrolase [unclassified Streptomyces]AVV42025.1 peptidase [Streptomyces sp. P3]MDX5565821.1 alpha/beta hydrolase [Streptomyces sp. ID05-04B]